MTPTTIAGYLALFASVGFLFLFVNLLVGRFLRASDPTEEKRQIYECGEPTIGSSFVQFDLRFYVVALLFIIFDVEVAFFFPWATVFGKATHLMDPRAAIVETATVEGGEKSLQLTRAAQELYGEMGIPAAAMPHPSNRLSLAQNQEAVRRDAARLAAVSLVDILVFFAVLMVGFAYVWRRGDLDWVRAIGRQRPALAEEDRDLEPEAVFSAW